MKFTISIISLLMLVSASFAQDGKAFLKDNKLWVDGNPYLMIAGELHNSTSSSIEYLEEVWPKLKGLHINTVLATINWEQFEIEEGNYDYTMIDYLIQESRNNDLKLIVVWFGSWKNGQSSYVPLWVKKDTKRFPRVKDKNGNQTETLSVFSEESMKADAKAFSALMQRIKEKDHDNTVIMVQPENEVGIFQDIDYRKEALNAYEEEVPSLMLDYMSKNTENLKPELKSVWDAAGSKTSGSWKAVFGDNPQSKEFFMAWHYAKYINYVAEKGRQIHDLPMFVNAWIVQQPEDLPGVYPNGGPVSRVTDIYKAAAPSIDLVCPDIYLPNYKEIYEMYYRKSDNPLFVPESSLDAGRAFYAFGEYDALGFSPFGIEDAHGNLLYTYSNKVLKELAPVIVKYQGKGVMKGIHLTKDYQDQTFELGGYEVTLKIQDPNEPAYGLIIHTQDFEFIVVGMNFKVWFDKTTKNSLHYIGQVLEGKFEGEDFKMTRWLNGDETYHNELVRALGREIEITNEFELKETNLDVAEDEQFVYSPGGKGKVKYPGVYKVTLYNRPKR